MMLRNTLRIAGMTAGLLAVMPAFVSQAQMSVPGSFEISDTGAATYTIPIAVPPGTAGMQPALSLVYNSQGGNGLLGMGWSLSGLPAVTRCPKTIVQDGAVGGINYDANDRFCLEGQRLIATSGTYGADQTEYRTEREGFSKIVSYGTAGTGPAWFKVWTKSGQVMEFGNTGDSRIEAQGKATARLWAASKISDTKGNYLAFTYAEDNANGEYRPTRIDYAGNGSASVSPSASIRFTYENRSDIILFYQSGSLIKTTRRLTNVQTYVNETLVYEYRLTYDISPATQRSRILSVMLCEAAGLCLPATALGWQAQLALPAAPSPPSGTLGNYNPILMDLNGDGATDLFLQSTNGQPSQIMLSDGSGTLVTNAFAPVGWNTGNYNLIPFDFNADGKTDLFLQAKAAGQATYILLSNGDGTFSFLSFSPLGWDATSYNIIPFEFNGDGKTDLFLQSKTAGGVSYILLSTGSNVSSSDGSGNFTFLTFAPQGWDAVNYNLIALDFNGDGKSDIFLQSRISGHLSYIILSTGSAVSSADGSGNFTFLTFAPQGWDATNYSIIPFDFNGDGNTDLFLQSTIYGHASYIVLSSGSAVASSDGSENFNFLSFAPVGWDTSLFNIVAADFNGDGKDDLMLQATGSGRSSYIMLSDGVGNIVGTSFSPVDWHVYRVTAGDWNGDGAADIWVFNAAGGFSQQFHTGFLPDLLSGITSGLGNATAITYGPLTKGGALYAKGTTGAYPTVDIQGSLYVVSEVQTNDGLGGNYRSTYKYAAARSHVQGRGFLGFETMTAKDEQTLVEQVTTYLQADPYTGLVASRVKKLGATTLNETVNTYGQTSLGGTRSFVYLTQSVEKSWELNGSLVSQVTTTHQYDAYGNATQVAVATPDGYSKTTTNTYQNDALNWLLGRLTRASVTSVTPN